MQNTYGYISDGKRVTNANAPIIISVIIVSLCFFHYITRSTVFFVIAMLVLACTVVLLDWQRTLLLMAVLIPNIMLIKLVGNPTAFLGYFLLLAELKHILVRRFAVKIPLVFIINAGLTCITAAIYQEWGALIFPMIRTMAFFVFICAVCTDKEAFNQNYRVQLLRLYVLGLCLAVVFALIYRVLPLRQHSIFAGLGSGRNFFCSAVITGLTIIPIQIKATKKIEAKMVVAAALLVYGGLETGSRTFFVAIAAVLLLVVIALNPIDYWKQLLVVVLLAGLLILQFRHQFASAVERILYRFTTDDVTGGNGRVEAWIYYIKLAMSSGVRFIFGNGDAAKYIGQGKIDVVEHNTFVQLFSTFGFTGLITLLLCYYTIVKKMMAVEIALGLIGWLIAIPFIICYSGISALHADAFNFQIMITAVTIRYANEGRAAKRLNA